MAELKTKRHKGDVHAFLNSVPDEKKRQDSFTISTQARFLAFCKFPGRDSQIRPLSREFPENPFFFILGYYYPNR
jgi:hypothetical protein